VSHEQLWGPHVCRARGHHTFRGLARALDADLRRVRRETRGSADEHMGALARLSALATPQGLVVALHRFSHMLWTCNLRRLAEVASWANFLLHKVAIRPDSCIDGGLWVPHPPGVSFHGNGGRDVGLYADSACLPLAPLAAESCADGPSLGDGVVIGTHVSVLGAIRVGSGTKLPFKIVLRTAAPPDSVGASRSLRPKVRQIDR